MEKSRTAEQIFADMHRQLRSWNRQIPESPERLDPLLKILLQMYADQLARIDKRLDLTWEIAAGSLIRSLAPECSRWPVPAYTVMRCRPVDPVVAVDPHTRFFYKEKREGGQTFFFSPLRTEKAFSAQVRHIFLRLDDTIVDLSPPPEGGTVSAAAPPQPASLTGVAQLFVALEYGGQPADLSGASLFLRGAPEARKQLRWSHWYPGSHRGSFYEDSGFCPGLAGGVEAVVTPDGQDRDWGGLRTAADVFKPLEDSFAVLPESFAITWEPGPANEELSQLMDKSAIDTASLADHAYWIRLDLPPGGDRSKVARGLDICFDCIIAINRNELKLFKHTGGSRLIDIELPEPISTILEVTGVVDSDGREYVPVYNIQPDRSLRRYSLEERADRLVLWFDFSASIDPPPDSISVTYAVTAGVAANAIEAGKIAELYEGHPGIDSVENVIPTAGAIPAKTPEQIVQEASSRLRGRDRALTFQQISNWAATFDPRIQSVTCENGVERAQRGVRRCIVVTVEVKREDFVSDDETAFLRTRLESFLKARSPVNTRFRIEIVKK